jgi:hypothetical protein
MAETEKGRTKHHTGTDPTPFAASRLPNFLIANLELEFELTLRNESPLRISNRKYFAIFHSRRSSTTFPLLFLSSLQPQPSSFEKLIANPRLDSKLNPRKISQLQISNRERMAISESHLLLGLPARHRSLITRHSISNRNSRITENQSSSSKQRTKQISNRNKNAVVGTPRFSRLGGSRITSHQLRVTNMTLVRAYNGNQRLAEKCPN